MPDFSLMATIIAASVYANMAKIGKFVKFVKCYEVNDVGQRRRRRAWQTLFVDTSST
jgi:hypothetical protein